VYVCRYSSLHLAGKFHVCHISYSRRNGKYFTRQIKILLAYIRVWITAASRYWENATTITWPTMIIRHDMKLFSFEFSTFFASSSTRCARAGELSPVKHTIRFYSGTHCLERGKYCRRRIGVSAYRRVVSARLNGQWCRLKWRRPLIRLMFWVRDSNLTAIETDQWISALVHRGRHARPTVRRWPFTQQRLIYFLRMPRVRRLISIDTWCCLDATRSGLFSGLHDIIGTPRAQLLQPHQPYDKQQPPYFCWHAS